LAWKRKKRAKIPLEKRNKRKKYNKTLKIRQKQAKEMNKKVGKATKIEIINN
jgi:hypothetical protein